MAWSWYFGLVDFARFSMNAWTSFNCLLSPASNPGESWKMNCGLLSKMKGQLISWMLRWSASRSDHCFSWAKWANHRWGRLQLVCHGTWVQSLVENGMESAPNSFLCYRCEGPRLYCKPASTVWSCQHWPDRWQEYESDWISDEHWRSWDVCPCAGHDKRKWVTLCTFWYQLFMGTDKLQSWQVTTINLVWPLGVSIFAVDVLRCQNNVTFLTSHRERHKALVMI